MIYGANGYTGGLLAAAAVAAGHAPVLAGRTGEAITRLGDRLGVPARVAVLTDPAALDAALADVSVVAHCAGPFSATSAPMVDACLRTGTHYVDLTGEVDVFEAIYARHDEAVAARVALVPGVGFDVVPTEHLAVRLAAQLPAATDLDIALISRGGFSAGTLLTALEGVGLGGRVRGGGELVAVPMSHRSVRVPTTRGTVVAHSVALGDISAAYRSTGIPNITDFTAVPLGAAAGVAEPVLRRVLGIRLVQRAVAGAIRTLVSGPSDARRTETRSELWARAIAPDGRTASAGLVVSNTYDFTAASALAAVERLLAGTPVAPGAWTPSQAFGADFLREIPGGLVEDREL
ncbi:saccharopine dehydrogenase family protein [Nocardia asteroides]|uniref:saccharopine dehydrogenase family protein n=1 Tax=Nocardia asteroides TaxID=1824 RepID=UPI001E4114D7|nr:saccharopine dehydrogenase NADP-binding domain-containing protein [Nocardia asteroides]UGT58704.1 saccharopine dehydrogenase NADP-binding domain-containing protein [Nocardia asteroides]